MSKYVNKAKLMEMLTDGEMQKKLRAGTGEEAYMAVLSIVNFAPTEDVSPTLQLSPLEQDKALKMLLDGLCDIPMNPETEQIEEDYYIWPKGTDKEEIWYWFDEHHSKGIAYLLGFA